MTTTELMIIIGAGALGYWLVAVMWPNVRGSASPQRRPAVQPAPAAVMWHEELGVAKDASRATIDAAYQAKVAEYHPDRVAHFAPEVREQARARIEQLELAYDAALRDLEWLRPHRDD